MSALPDESRIISRYLLHDLTEDEQADVERRYFADPDFLALVEAVEGDLVDAYVRRELPAADRERFEKYYLRSRRRRDRVRMAEARLAWLEPGGPAAARPARWAAFAVAAVLVLIVAGVAWLWVENRRLRSDVDRLRVETARSQPSQPRVAPASSPVPAAKTGEDAGSTPSPAIVSIVLIPGVTRAGDATPRLVLPRGTDTARLRVMVEADGELRDLAATLRTSTGREVWSASSLKVEREGAARMLTLSVPAERLAAGEYILSVSDRGETIADYFFTAL